ncbi:response regulator transcription factor [Faecalicatena contorta]|uniref:response regulator transcription factor n=1 Tax=Faecalicatena contorta TaxID=39482 RepID=UPI0031D8B27B
MYAEYTLGVVKMKILIVEDDMTLAKELVLLCERWGFEAVYAKQFDDIANEYISRQPDLILMDINLPSFDGFYWCEKIRQISNVPLLYLSSRDQNADKVMAMAAGGDDYVEKPFDPELLLLKIRAMLRRAYEYTTNERIYLNGGMYYESGQFVCNGMTVDLTKSESKIMAALLSKKGSVVSREKLMQQLWNTDEFVTDASLSVLVSRLRAKLNEVTGGSDIIVTKKGMGYYIE